MGWSIPTTTPQSIKAGQNGIHVWALQSVLNDFDDLHYQITADGVFGDQTDTAVKDYQRRTNLVVDGIAGHNTQARLVRSVELRVGDMGLTTKIPERLIESVIEGESTRYIAAVNWSIAGGVDCGWTQRRILAPYTDEEIEWAFHPVLQYRLLATRLTELYNRYRGKPAVRRRADWPVYSWRLATLYHNWPYASELLSEGGELSTTRIATWVPRDKNGEIIVHFADGEKVVTYRDWAAFYAMGSKTHKHEGNVVKLTNFGTPSYW